MAGNNSQTVEAYRIKYRVGENGKERRRPKLAQPKSGMRR